MTGIAPFVENITEPAFAFVCTRATRAVSPFLCPTLSIPARANPGGERERVVHLLTVLVYRLFNSRMAIVSGVLPSYA